MIGIERKRETVGGFSEIEARCRLTGQELVFQIFGGASLIQEDKHRPCAGASFNFR